MSIEETGSYEDQPEGVSGAVSAAPPPAVLGAYGLAGVLLAVASMWGFLVLADEVPEHGWMVHMDLAVTTWLQVHGTERGEAACVFISLFGGDLLAAGAMIFLAFLIRRRRWHRAWFLAITVGGGSLLNVLLKTLFHRVRPTVAVEFHMVSWSFPSGHAMASLIFYGLLARWASRDLPMGRGAIWTTAVAMIAAIGFARVYLGVHYVSDVAAGYIAGFVWLVACVMAERVALLRRMRASAAARRPQAELTRTPAQ
jgi:membrane-associated phospholipid phosphatase